MRALVTGATGFVGGALARRLKRLGHQVTGTGRDRPKGALLRAQGIRFEEADLEDGAAALRLCKGQDWAFHCGALSSAWGAKADFYKANVLGTRLLAQAARKQKLKRFIHVSSPSVCMDGSSQLGLREDGPLPSRPVNAYAWSKRLAEEEIHIASRGGLGALILRPQAVFGPGDQALFPRILRVAAKGSFPKIGGRTLVDVTPVENVVDAMLLAAKAPKACLGRTYHISNGSPEDMDLLLDSIFKRLNLSVRRPWMPLAPAYAAAALLEAWHRRFMPEKEPILTRYSVLVLGRSRSLDISRARQELGYRPKVSVEAALESFAKWWRAQHAP